MDEDKRNIRFIEERKNNFHGKYSIIYRYKYHLAILVLGNFTAVPLDITLIVIENNFKQQQTYTLWSGEETLFRVLSCGN